jgi:ATP-dependent helicase/nuclease subunit A
MNEPSLHPILSSKDMQPSKEQRPAIVARDCDVLVTAGAGSGKTRTLAARFLARLAEGAPLRSISAITFTKKAALEMRNRVRAEIRAYLERDDLSADERDVWAAHAVALDAARIGTIHALCQEILHAHPAEAALDPAFGVLDEAQSSLLRARIIDDVLTNALADPTTAALFDAHGEEMLRDLLGRMLLLRLEAGQALRITPENGCADVIARVARMFADPTVRDGIAALQELRTSGVLAAAQAAGDDGAPVVAEVLAAWDAACAAHADADPAGVLDGMANALAATHLTKGKKGNWRGHDPKGAMKRIREGWAADEKFLGKRPSLHIDAANGAEHAAFVALFEHADRAYAAARRAMNALDFDDLEARALELLRTRADVRARWQRELTEIMVDEFQDTNARQLELVRILSGSEDGVAGRLFYVGDPKQSIYRFRGADVRIFRSEKQRIGASVELSVSYRAHSALVQAMNELLRPVMAEQFAPLQAHRAQSRAGFDGASIELHLVLGARAGAATQCARAVAARIREIAAAGSVEWDDVAVLCRASSSFAAYEDAFEHAGIPFLTVAGRGFYDRPEVRDALTQLQAVADPSDELALAGLLRSPAFGVSDVGLYRMRWDGVRRRGLRAALQDAERIFDEGDPDRPAAVRAREILRALRAAAGRVSAGSLLQRLFDATQFPAMLVRAGMVRRARNLEKLVADAHAGGILSVSEFVEMVTHMRTNDVREGEARAGSEGAVQLMTVHASKGLEWPVVVLGDMSYESPVHFGVRFDERDGLLAPQRRGFAGQSAAYCHAHERESVQAAEESARLLYVAMTRAEEMLLLAGTAAKPSTKKEISAKGWLGSLTTSGALDLSALPIAEYDADLGERTHERIVRSGASEVRCLLHEPRRWAATIDG